MVDLLALALQAVDDEDARRVLADAIEEAGWDDERARSLGGFAGRPLGVDPWRELLRSGMPFPARAVVAVLLFGGWDDEPWPVGVAAGYTPWPTIANASGETLDQIANALFGVDRIPPEETDAALRERCRALLQRLRPHEDPAALVFDPERPDRFVFDYRQRGGNG